MAVAEMPPSTQTADQPKPPPQEARCSACGGWIATVPSGTPWARGRCYTRVNGHACKLYGKGQTVHLR